MSEAAYAAMREYIKVAVELEVQKRIGEVRSAPVTLPVAPTERPIDGKDGVGVAGVSIREGNLYVRLTDGSEHDAGRVVGRDGIDGAPGKDGERGIDGVDGRDGKDGINGRDGADGVATRSEIESIVEARYADVQVRSFADIYQGVYENGKQYTRGVLTTWGGSLWLAQSDTEKRPGETPDWKLIVKAGRDARK